MQLIIAQHWHSTKQINLATWEKVGTKSDNVFFLFKFEGWQPKVIPHLLKDISGGFQSSDTEISRDRKKRTGEILEMKGGTKELFQRAEKKWQKIVPPLVGARSLFVRHQPSSVTSYCQPMGKEPAAEIFNIIFPFLSSIIFQGLWHLKNW